MSNASVLRQIRHCWTIECFQKALDQTYRYLLEAAKADWQQLFAENEPGDNCVSVRTTNEQKADELAGIPRPGVGPISQQKPINGKVRRKLA